MSRCIALQAPARTGVRTAAASATARRAALPPSTGASLAGRRLAARPTAAAVRRGGGLSVFAIQVSGPGNNPFDETPVPGSFDPNASKPIIDGMIVKIKEALEAESVDVEDVYGDGQHVNISVVSAAFEGKRSVQRQQMVFKAIWEEMQEKVHAVDSMTTKTPEEAAA